PASSNILAGVMCGPGSSAKSIPVQSAISLSPSTRARISLPESAGIGPPVAGSIRIEIVPPVKTIAIVGFIWLEAVSPPSVSSDSHRSSRWGDMSAPEAEFVAHVHHFAGLEMDLDKLRSTDRL